MVVRMMEKAVGEWVLLEPGARRSEHPEAARFAMRPVTGAFLDPSIESAFGAHLFHVAFPIHVLLFSFLFAVSVWITAVAPKDEVGAWKIILLGTVLGMAGRVLLHVSHWSMEDNVIAQRIASRSWLALMAVCNLVLVADLLANPAIECLAAERDILMVSAVSSNPAASRPDPRADSLLAPHALSASHGPRARSRQRIARHDFRAQDLHDRLSYPGRSDRPRDLHLLWGHDTFSGPGGEALGLALV